MNQHGSSEGPIYHWLNPKDHEIRLLEVLPSLRDGRIECQLSTARLKTAAFVVLSYRWGTQATTHEIVLNGQPFHVRQNLWDFLNVIRNQPGMSLWIDALCINQHDLEERNQQVRIMGQIFQSASMVLSWLGVDNILIQQAFELMSSVWSSSASANESDQLPLSHASQSEDDLWRSVAELCSLPYWGRIWVVQEIVLSSNNYLLCGQKTLPWQVFANFLSLVDIRFWCPPQYARIIHNSTAKSYAVSKPYVMVPQSLQWRVGNVLKHDFGKSWDSKEHNLFRILTMFGDRECTDPHDHVYALLSLSDEGVSFPIHYGIDQYLLFLSLVHFCGESSVQIRDEALSPLVLKQNSQRAFIRNTKYLAETLELISATSRTQPYYHGSGVDTRKPSPRPNPCFPCTDQVLVLQCTTIVPGNEPPILRSNTLRRSINGIPFQLLLHVDESSSWLMCQRQNEDTNKLRVIGVIAIKDGPQGKGFRILEPGALATGTLTSLHDVGFEDRWTLSVAPEAHSHLLKVIILGQQPD